MPNATVRANARSMPKPPPQAAVPSALAQATVELEAAVDELHLARGFMDLEEPLREVRYMASIVHSLVMDHAVRRQNGGTFVLSDHEMSRLLFVASKVSNMAVDLDEAYHKAWDKTVNAEGVR
jgi:hypothetical protein